MPSRSFSVSVSAFVVQSAAARAATVLADRPLIELGSEAAAAFTEALGVSQRPRSSRPFSAGPTRIWRRSSLVIDMASRWQ